MNAEVVYWFVGETPGRGKFMYEANSVDEESLNKELEQFRKGFGIPDTWLGADGYYCKVVSGRPHASLFKSHKVIDAIPKANQADKER